MFQIKKIFLVALLMVIFPVLTFAQDATTVGTYTLSNKRPFVGTQPEYLFAEYLLSVTGNMQSVMNKSWDSQAKKNAKNFADTKKILATAKFEGDAGYNSKTKEYYIKNNSKFTKNRITFEVDNKNLKSNFTKLDKAFAGEFQKSFNKLNKKLISDLEKKVSKLLGYKIDFDDFEDDGSDEDFTPGTDIHYLLSVFEELSNASDRTYAQSFNELRLEVTGYTNTTAKIPMNVYATAPDGTTGFPANPVFNQVKSNGWSSGDKIIKVDIRDVVTSYGKYYINIEFAGPEYTAPDTILNFKVNEIRQIGTLKSSDIWQSEFNFNEWKIEQMMRDYGVDYFKNR